MSTIKSVTPAGLRLVDPLVLKKKINKIGNPGECAVLSSLLCYIISLDCSDATKAITEKLPIKVLKNKAQNKTQEQLNSKKAIRPTRFQLLQSKFLNPNHEPPRKKPKEVGKLIFKENRDTLPCSTGSIVKKLDASKLKLSKEEKIENDLHFRTDKNQWNKLNGKGRVKSILNKFAAAEEKEKKSTKPTNSKNYTPKMHIKGIDILKEKCEQNSTICSVKLVKPSLVPKEQTVKKEIIASIKHLRQEEDHVAHTTIMTATCLETSVLEHAVLSEQNIHTFLPTSMITEMYTSEAPKPSSKEMDKEGKLCQNDKHNQVVCFNLSSSTTGSNQQDMEYNCQRGTDGQCEVKVTEPTENTHCCNLKGINQKSTSMYGLDSNNILDTIDTQSLDILGVVGHGEEETLNKTDLQSEKEYYDNIDQVTKQSGIDSTDSLHVYVSCKDSIPNNISDKDVKDGSKTKECKLDDDGQICDTTESKYISKNNNITASMKDNNESEKVLNIQQNINSYTKRFQCPDKEEVDSNTDTMSACLETEGPKQLNVPTSGTQKDNNFTKRFQWTDKEEGNSTPDKMPMCVESESTKQPNVPMCGIDNDKVCTRTADHFEHIDEVMIVASERSISLHPIKDSEKNLYIPRKAVNPTESNKKTSELLPHSTSYQNNSVSEKNRCKDRNIILESKYGKECEFYEQEHLLQVIPSILSLTDKATFTTEPSVPFVMALEKEIKVHQRISGDASCVKQTENLIKKQSLATEQKQKQLISCNTSQVLKLKVFPQVILQSHETLNQLESEDLGGRGMSTFQIPLPKEFPGKPSPFSSTPKTTNIGALNASKYVKQPEGLENTYSSVVVNAQKQARDTCDNKVAISDKNSLESRNENQLPMISKDLFHENKNIMSNKEPTEHLSENVHAVSRKDIVKYETPSTSNHLSDQDSLVSGMQRATNDNFNILKPYSQVDSFEKKNQCSLPPRPETPTKAVIKGKQAPTKHSQGNSHAANRTVTSKYQIPSSKDLTSDQLSRASHIQSTNNIPINDLSKYKVQSYKDTTISKQMFKPLVVRACDTFKH